MQAAMGVLLEESSKLGLEIVLVGGAFKVGGKIYKTASEAYAATTKSLKLPAQVTAQLATGVFKNTEDFFQGTKYSQKVKSQIGIGDFHSFPESVKTFQDKGRITEIIGNDGITRLKLEIPGVYKGKKSFFEFIKEPDGTINHRLFRSGDVK